MKSGTQILRRYQGADFNIPPAAAQVLRNAYLLLAGTMLPMVCGVYLGMLFPVFSYVNPWVAMGIDLVISLYAIFAIHRHKTSVTGIYWLLFLTFVTGYFVAPVISVYAAMAQGPQMIMLALTGTATLFVTLSFVGRSTKYNLSGPTFGLFLLVGLVLMLILGIVNILFVQLTLLSLLFAFGVMAICSLLIMYETNLVVRGGETSYIVVALGFYLSLINIFLSLLRIFSFFSGNRD